MKKFSAIFFYVVLAAAMLFCIPAALNMRAKNAENRAVHADEGEQTFTFAKLHQNNDYKYNPEGPHGPVLYYWADIMLPKEKAQTFEVQDLRKTLYPVFLFTLASVFAFGLFCGREKNSKGKRLQMFSTAAFSAVLIMFSSLSLIYSTYFVQETFFALFSLWLAGSFYWFLKSRSAISAIALGISMGLLQSAKETSIIVLASAFAGFSLLLISQNKEENSKFIADIKKTGFPKCLSLVFLIFICAFAIYAPFYSSFGNNWHGISDGVKSYTHFFHKSGAVAHTKDYFYYIKLMSGQTCEGVLFGETAIFILSILGTIIAFLKNNPFVKYLAGFSWANILILSFIGYKTPWLLLSPIVSASIVAGYAVSVLLFFKTPKIPIYANAAVKILIAAIIACLFNLQYKEAQNAALKYASAPRNPFLYVHTVKNSERLVRRVKECSKAAKSLGEEFNVLVLTMNSPWPLPWQLIRVDGVKFSQNEEDAKNADKYSMVIFDDDFEYAFKNKFPESEWVEEYFGLRENLLLHAYSKRKIFDKSIE